MARLRRIAAGCASADDQSWFSSGLSAYERRAPDGATLDQELGLITYGGGTAWWEVERLDRRNHAIRELADQFDMSPISISIAFRRYESSAWPRDRRLDQCPDAYLGTPKELLFVALKNGPVPLSDRQIKTILEIK